MRQNKYLILEAKQSTNTVDVDAITDDLCIRYLNRAQEFIQAYLFTQNIEAKIFRGQASFTTTVGIDTYQLPFNIYAKNSINNVMYKNGDAYSPMPQIAEKARGSMNGYFCSDNKIILSPMPSSPVSLFLSYTKRLASLGRSYGKIASVTTDTSITLDTGYSVMTDVDDFYSIVDSNGVIVKYAVPVSQTLAVVLISETTGVTAGMFVVPGKYATTHCELPDELESSMIMSLENLINARLSSKDIQISKILGDDQLMMIGEMFSENQTDTFMPPLTEYTEWA